MSRSRLSLSRTFALLSFAIIALITALQVAVQWSLLRADLLAWERAVSAEAIATEVQARLQPEDFGRWQDAEVRARFDQVFGRVRAQREILRVKVYDTGSRVVWSDEPRLLGVRFADNPRLEEALAGRIVADLEPALKPENLYERHFGESVELYIPLVFGAASPGARPVAVVEIYKTPAAALANLSRDRWTIVATSLIGALVLYGGLFGVVHRASRQLDAQRERLERQAAALTAANDALRTAQGQLRAAERLAAVGEVSAAVAHGLRNPLGSIRAMAQVALDAAGDATAVRKYGRAIMAEVDRLSCWLRDLLQFVRPFEPRLGPVALGTVVDEVLGALEARATRQHVKIERRLDGGLPVLQADGAQLQQALLSVVENALDALPDGGSVTIEAARTGDEPGAGVRVRVCDTGPGIAPERQRRLFEPFYTTKSEGTGLGLAIARKVVEGHGGTVALESALGAGTAVTLTVPASPAGGALP